MLSGSCKITKTAAYTLYGSLGSEVRVILKVTLDDEVEEALECWNREGNGTTGDDHA